MKTNYTVEQVQGMTSTELRKIASELGIKNYTSYSKSALSGLIESEIKPVKQSKSLMDIAKEEVDSIVNSTNVSKSEKFRMLFERGATPAQVSKEFNAHYSFVYGVKRRWEQKK